MPRLTIYKNKPVENTVVPNLFIDEYMKNANDAQIKVYLYLLRMMNAQQATSVSDIADQFNHTEKEVLRALKYWEKEQLLDLDYDNGKNLVGIHVRDLGANADAEIKNMPQTASSFVPVPADTVREQTGLAYNAEEIHAPAAKTEAADPYAKPSYSPDQLREFKEREDTAQLLFIAESYIGRPLTPAEMKTILYFMDVLNFSEDLIDYLIQYCVDKGKKDFKYIEKVAINWASEGITTPSQAQSQSARHDKNVYAIMNGLGKTSTPTPKELEYITRWLKDYAFTPDIIIEACERTVLATDKHRFEYAEGILNSWKRQNVRHKSDIAQIDNMYQQRKKSTVSPTAPKPVQNRFNRFTQNNYDFDALEQELLSN